MNALIIYSVLSDWTQNDLLIVVDAAQEMARGIAATGLRVRTLPVKDQTVEQVLESYDPQETIVLNWCEGLYRDERNFHDVPAELERLGFTYTGSPPRTLKITQSKAVVRHILESQGIPVPFATVITPHSIESGVDHKWKWFPALVKPSNEHGSFGIVKENVVDNWMQLEDRAKATMDQFPGPVVVENFVDGDEYNVAIWGTEEKLEVLPLARINYNAFGDYHDRLCTFDSKWKEGTDAYTKTKVECPAEVDDALGERIRSTALRSYTALDLRDYGRIDIRVRNGIPYVLDVNANPDITSGGGFARATRKAGFNYGQMARQLVNLAAARVGLQ